MARETIRGEPRLVQIDKTGIYTFENLQRNPELEERLIDGIKQEVKRLTDLDRQTKVIV